MGWQMCFSLNGYEYFLSQHETPDKDLKDRPMSQSRVPSKRNHRVE